MRELSTSRLQGAFYLVTGIWPLLHMRSFEAVSGPKTDTWLVRAAGLLIAVIGYAQLRAKETPESLEQARRLGTGTAGALGSIDVFYALRGRISKVFLLDAAVEAAFLARWLRRRT
ncbi:hypothetical protein [Sinomonas mesophila]|uniref:hypothetical protein n=1 Tax=Sinomonas mesophila TaxID=1531955 RepID=UPI0009846BA9|nr:hypothetical protein [Sinomonas mesophila]